MTRQKFKIVLLSLSLIAGLVIGFYFCGFFHLALTRNFNTLSQLKFTTIFKSILTNKNHFLIFILTESITTCLITIFILISPRETYESEKNKITPTIETPIKVAQNQHGSAKWLEEKSYSEIFGTCKIEITDPIINSLVENGKNLKNQIETKSQYESNLKINQPIIKKGGLVVGYDKKSNSEEFHYLDDDVHSIIIGATRSGKTRSIVLQSIILTAFAGESMVICDPKAEIFHYTAPLLKNLGYEVITLDFKNPLKSNKYNFLQPVIDAVNKNDTAKAVTLIWDITSSLVDDTNVTEKIWTNGEASVIAGSIMAVVFDNKNQPQYQNFTNVYHFILNMCKTIGDDMPINKYIKNIPNNHPAKALFGIAQIAPSRTRGSFFTSALTTLRLFTNENIYAQTCKSDFNLSETGNKKMGIFIILPDEKTTFYSLASLFVYQHYVALIESADLFGGRLKHTVEFFLDEYGNFTKIPSFSNMLTAGGSRGIRFHLFLQSFSQLEEKYGKEVSETIKDNCHAWIYIKTSNITTAEVISKKLGQYTTSSYTRSSSYNSGGGYNASLSASMNLIGRPLLTEDEVMRIEKPYVLVMYSGNYPAITKLPDISKQIFNTILGLGNKEHNIKLRIFREDNRLEKEPIPIELWEIWKIYDITENPKNTKNTNQNKGLTPYEQKMKSQMIAMKARDFDENF